MDFLLLLKDIEEHIKKMAAANTTLGLQYHNLHHTIYVVNAAVKISHHYKPDDKDFFIVMAACWFHDTGYYFGAAAGHELKSAELATAFLQSKGVEEPLITTINQCILATRIPQKPANLLEQIVCDADLFHLGTDDFFKFDKLMRKEQEDHSGVKISKDDWRRHTLAFMGAHEYHTEYCKGHLNKKKAENLDEIRKKLAEKEAEAPVSLRAQVSEIPLPALPESTLDKKGKNGKEAKEEKPGRGVETMFRVSSGNHQRLSDMADNKAHILITTTSIIISVLLSVLLRKLEDNPWLTFPTLLLLTVCAISMVFSILATRPSIPKGVFTQEDVAARKVNLLFFGNFYRMQFTDFEDGMQQMMEDRDFLYGSLIRDLYAQGVVLGKKYRLLRMAYSVFMFGIIASIIFFSVATIFFGH